MALKDYIGFSTIDGRPPYRFRGKELIKRDLLNEFTTRIGERLMRPDFGTILFDLLGEPNDDQTKEAAQQDVVRILKRDPRVNLVNVTVIQEDHFIQLDMEVAYNPGNVKDSFYVRYQRDTGRVTTDVRTN